MVKPTSATTTTCRQTTENNAPQPKWTQEQMKNSHGIPITRTKVKEKKQGRMKEESTEQQLITEGYNSDFKKLLGVPAILPKASPI